MFSVQKLHDDLDYWNHIEIGSDIVLSRENRPEYQHLVSKALLAKVPSGEIHKFVLWQLKVELLRKPWMRPSFYSLLWLWIKTKLSW